MWASRPVFISSTFADMQAERDHLRRFVFPALEERLSAHRMHLEWVDLRLGVATAGQTDLAAKEAEVLKVCLAEVRRCRPFLLVLMGDRYGWVPPLERMRAAALEEGIDGDVAGKSVTELEIQFGVLGQGADASRSLIYFREPIEGQTLPASMRDAFRDRDAAAAVKLDALKRRIARTLPSRVQSYRLCWDASAGCISGLDSWGLMVLEDLWDALSADLAGAPARPPSWQEEDRAALDAFIEQRGRGFVGRTTLLDDLLAHAASKQQPWGICVTAEAGGGKSALFAELNRRLAKTDALVLSHASSASPRSASVASMLRRWIDELARALGEAAQAAAPSANIQDLQIAFSDLLSRLAQKRRVILLIDALDQFEAGLSAQHMTWLPKQWPAGARLITTAIDGQASRALAERGVRMLALAPIDQAEGARIVATICALYHRRFEPEVVQALLAKRGAAGPAFGQPLWLTLATEELNLIDGDDIARAHRQYPGRADEQLRALLVDRAKSLPASVSDIYGATFDHAESLFGDRFARSFLFLLALGRGGWRETDFRALLPRFSGEEWSELRFASLRRVFRGQLGRIGADGQWNCLHAQMRVAAHGRIKLSTIPESRLHGVIAEYLLTLPASDPLHESETMRHLLGAQEWARAAAYYGGEARTDPELQGANDAVADLVAEYGDLAGFESLLAADANGDDAERIMPHCLVSVRDRLASRAPLGVQLRCAKLVLAACERVSAARSDLIDRQLYVSAAHLGVGQLLDQTGERGEARNAYAAALRVAEDANRKAPNHPGGLHHLLLVHQKLVGVLRESGASGEASALTRTAIAIARQLIALDPSDAPALHELSVAQGARGEALAAVGDLAGAAEAQRQSVEAARALASHDKGDPNFIHDEANALARQSEVSEQQGDLAGAERLCRDALDAFERAIALAPDNNFYRANKAVAQGMLARYLYSARSYAASAQTYDAAIQALTTLTQKESGNTDWRRSLMVLLHGKGELQMRQGQTAGAGKSYRTALELMAPLARRDPNNVQWLRDVAGLHSALAAQQQAIGDHRGAAESHAETLRLTEKWVIADSDDTAALRDLGLRHDAVGYTHLESGDFAAAQRSFDKGTELITRLTNLDPANAGWRRDLAGTHQSHAALARARKDMPGLVRWQQSAEQLLCKIASDNPSNTRAQTEHALILAQLGQSQMMSGRQDNGLNSIRGARASLRALAARGALDAELKEILRKLETFP